MGLFTLFFILNKLILLQLYNLHYFVSQLKQLTLITSRCGISEVSAFIFIFKIDRDIIDICSDSNFYFQRTIFNLSMNFTCLLGHPVDGCF